MILADMKKMLSGGAGFFEKELDFLREICFNVAIRLDAG